MSRTVERRKVGRVGFRFNNWQDMRDARVRSLSIAANKGGKEGKSYGKTGKESGRKHSEVGSDSVYEQAHRRFVVESIWEEVFGEEVCIQEGWREGEALGEKVLCEAEGCGRPYGGEGASEEKDTGFGAGAAARVCSAEGFEVFLAAEVSGHNQESFDCGAAGNVAGEPGLLHGEGPRGWTCQEFGEQGVLRRERGAECADGIDEGPQTDGCGAEEGREAGLGSEGGRLAEDSVYTCDWCGRAYAVRGKHRSPWREGFGGVGCAGHGGSPHPPFYCSKGAGANWKEAA